MNPLMVAEGALHLGFLVMINISAYPIPHFFGAQPEKQSNFWLF
jgi:hypothetical protein